MMETKFFDEFAARVSELAAASPLKDVEHNVRALLASGFAKLDLVPRAEFEVHKALLNSALERLAALEAKLGAEEQK